MFVSVEMKLQKWQCLEQLIVTKTRWTSFVDVVADDKTYHVSQSNHFSIEFEPISESKVVVTDGALNENLL